MTLLRLSFLLLFLPLTLGDVIPNNCFGDQDNNLDTGQSQDTIGNFSSWHNTDWKINKDGFAWLRPHEPPGNLTSPWVCAPQATASRHHCLILELSIDNRGGQLSVYLAQNVGNGKIKSFVLLSVCTDSAPHRQSYAIAFTAAVRNFKIVIEGRPFNSRIGVNYKRYENNQCNYLLSKEGPQRKRPFPTHGNRIPPVGGQSKGDNKGLATAPDSANINSMDSTAFRGSRNPKQPHSKIGEAKTRTTSRRNQACQNTTQKPLTATSTKETTSTSTTTTTTRKTTTTTTMTIIKTSSSRRTTTTAATKPTATEKTVTASTTSATVTRPTTRKMAAVSASSETKSSPVDTENESDGISQTEDDLSSNLSITVIILAVTAAVVVIVLVIIAVCWRQRSSRKRRNAANRSGENIGMNANPMGPIHTDEAPAAGIPAIEGNYSTISEVNIGSGSLATTGATSSNTDSTAPAAVNQQAQNPSLSSVVNKPKKKGRMLEVKTDQAQGQNTESSQKQEQPPPLYSVVNKPNKGQQLKLKADGADGARKVTEPQKPGPDTNGDYNVIDFQGKRKTPKSNPLGSAEQDVYNRLDAGVLKPLPSGVDPSASSRQTPSTSRGGGKGLYHVLEPDPENPSVLKYKDSDEYHHLDLQRRSEREGRRDGARAKGGGADRGGGGVGAVGGRGGGNLYDHVQAAGNEEDTYDRVQRDRKPAIVIDETYSHIP